MNVLTISILITVLQKLDRWHMKKRSIVGWPAFEGFFLSRTRSIDKVTGSSRASKRKASDLLTRDSWLYYYLLWIIELIHDLLSFYHILPIVCVCMRYVSLASCIPRSLKTQNSACSSLKFLTLTILSLDSELQILAKQTESVAPHESYNCHQLPAFDVLSTSSLRPQAPARSLAWRPVPSIPKLWTLHFTRFTF